MQLRFGRPEGSIGSSWLLAAAQGLNVKRIFDGALFTYTLGNWSVPAAIARPVKLKPGYIDGPPDSGIDTAHMT